LQNRSIATLAITTLLKTGNEGGVDRLMKQIGTFMSDIADEFKIVVVEAIRSMCIKFPQKYRSM
jgi:coatomer protein complex subunit gamma